MVYFYSSTHLLLCSFVIYCVLLLSDGRRFGIPSEYYSSLDTHEEKNRILIERREKIDELFIPLLFINVPPNFCEVTFKVRKRHVKNGIHYYKNVTAANFGNRLLITDTFNKPLVEFDRDPDKYYTVLMLDTDAPSIRNQKYRCWLHWFVANIPYSDITFKRAQTLVEYVGPWPQKLTGKHHYVILVYAHGNIIEYEQPYLNVTDFVQRRNFSTYNFEEQYNLDPPIAINYFVVKPDKLVNQIYTNFPMVHLP